MLPILTSDERIIIPKLQFSESEFFEPERETKIGSKNFEKSGGIKITVFDRGEGNDFWFKLSGGSKK